MSAPTLTSTGIRTDLVARLIAAATPAASKVYDSRKVDVEKDDLPCIVVISTGGSEDVWSKTTKLNKHTEKVSVTGIVTGTDEAVLAANVDAMEAAIVDGLLSDSEWLCSFESVSSVKVDKTLDLSSRNRVGGVSVSFEVVYPVTYTAVYTVPFHHVAVTTESENPTGADVSLRVIDLAQ